MTLNVKIWQCLLTEIMVKGGLKNVIHLLLHPTVLSDELCLLR